MSAPVQTQDKPPNAGLLLSVLVLGAIVANVNLGIANVALPDIGRSLQASQVELTAIASAFSVGLACSVLYLGAVGDRYGRKRLLLAGAFLSIPTSMLAAWAPSTEILLAARLLGGVAAGMLFPTTLSIISALWKGTSQTKAIAIWSGVGGAGASAGGIVGGLLLERFWWGSVFLITAPFALLVFVGALLAAPSYAGEDNAPIDHVGGVLSLIGVASLVLAVQDIPDGWTSRLVVEATIAAVALPLFIWRQMRARRPLVDLDAASAPSFWVGWVAATLTFGSLIGVMFLGTQFTQNVLSYSPLSAVLVTLPCSLTLVIATPSPAGLA